MAGEPLMQAPQTLDSLPNVAGGLAPADLQPPLAGEPILAGQACSIGGG